MSDNAIATPLVSVYCMTYNQEKTIAQAIEGIVTQKTDFPFELIIHDDASTDRTVDIVREYAARYPEIIRPIYQAENKFHTCNLIKTFIHPVSRGKYIALCEGDDYWTDPDKLQLQAEYMESDPDCSLCFHAVQQLTPDGKLMNYRPLKETGKVSASLVIKRGGLFCPTASLMFRRDVMDTWPAFREQADVYDYPAQVLAATMGRVHYIDRIMGVYRFASDGSWTAQHADIIDYAHVKNETHWLELFNAYTDNAYKDAVNYHMAHMWFTEYRKTIDPAVRDTAKVYIRQLGLKDRMVFSTLLAVFSVMGSRANTLWRMLKKHILK